VHKTRTKGAIGLRRVMPALYKIMDYLKIHYYDANCLVKLVVDEKDSTKLRQYFYEADSVAITTSFCFYEALSVLKTKWVKTNRADTISEKTYLTACLELSALIENGNIQLEELSFYDSKSLRESIDISREHNIDLSDSFQLVTLSKGMIAKLDPKITPILLSEDKGINKAAKIMGLPVSKISDLNV